MKRAATACTTHHCCDCLHEQLVVLREIADRIDQWRTGDEPSLDRIYRLVGEAKQLEAGMRGPRS